MKLHRDQDDALNTVTAYEQGWIEVNAVRHQGAVWFMPDGDVRAWAVSDFEGLAPEALAPLLEAAPEIILLGTGTKQRFPHPRVLAPWISARTGHEVMSTPAACRTYNILMAEGRRVMAALLPIDEPPST